MNEFYDKIILLLFYINILYDRVQYTLLGQGKNKTMVQHPIFMLLLIDCLIDVVDSVRNCKLMVQSVKVIIIR
jgi:hypothetical protein